VASLKIAQIAPLYEAVPPRLYGGTERIVAHLTNAPRNSLLGRFAQMRLQFAEGLLDWVEIR
jgi:hypothetical protein